MTKGQKAYYTAITFIIVITLAIIISPISHADVEITVNDNEEVTFTTVENESTEIERLLYWHPLWSSYDLDSNYYDFSEITVDWSDLRVVSNITPWQAEKLLRGGLKGYSDAFVKAEKDYRINAVFLINLARHESGNGTYSLMDYNNIFSYGAYDENIYQAVKFNSVEECIDIIAKYIRDEYLTEGGKWFNGYSVEDVNKRYAMDENWAERIRKMN